MPIIVQTNSGSGATGSGSQTASTPVSAIEACTSQDVRQVIGTTGAGDVSLLIDYTNRIQQMILRFTRWRFMLSDEMFFITQREQTDYWIGPTGQGPAGTVETGLNITNMDLIKRDSVMDQSNWVPLQPTDNRPAAAQISFRDDQYRVGKPAEFREDPLTENVIQIYPAPDNQNNYQPVPPTPYVSFAQGGALPNRTYFFVYTFVDSFGNEGTQSDRESQTNVPAGFLATAHSPRQYFEGTALGTVYSSYNVYASNQTLGPYYLQNPSPLSMGQDFPEPSTGLIIGGIQPPSDSGLAIMDGYIISFRYYRTRPIVKVPGDILSVPDIYKDVVCSGVNWLGYQYLQRPEEAQFWQGEFSQGMVQMIKDRNLFPQGALFINPDSASYGMGSRAPFIETYDFLR